MNFHPRMLSLLRLWMKLNGSQSRSYSDIYCRLLGIDDVVLQAVDSLHFGATYHHHHKAGTWRQYVPPKRRLVSTRLYSVITHNMIHLKNALQNSNVPYTTSFKWLIKLIWKLNALLSSPPDTAWNSLQQWVTHIEVPNIRIFAMPCKNLRTVELVFIKFRKYKIYYKLA